MAQILSTASRLARDFEGAAVSGASNRWAEPGGRGVGGAVAQRNRILRGAGNGPARAGGRDLEGGRQGSALASVDRPRGRGLGGAFPTPPPARREGKVPGARA